MFATGVFIAEWSDPTEDADVTFVTQQLVKHLTLNLVNFILTCFGLFDFLLVIFDVLS